MLLSKSGWINGRNRKKQVSILASESFVSKYGKKTAIFNDDRYVIFYAYEVFILCGRNVISPNGIPERITKGDILRKYGVLWEQATAEPFFSFSFI